jgi:hypothetical protein
VFLLVSAGGCRRGNAGAPQIQNLPLQWRVDRMPVASASVAHAFASGPIEFALRDLRTEPTAVGLYEKTGFVVHTADNVGQYCTDRLADMLSRAGAHLNQSQPIASVETELLEYRAIEGGTYHATAKLRINVRRGGGEPWTRTYEGSSRHSGRTHDPDRFNEVLSSSLQDAASKLVADEDFARALVGEPPAPLQRPAPARRGG